MRAARALALCLGTLAGHAGAATRAPEPAVAPSTPPPSVGGYFDTRLVYNSPRLDGLLSTYDTPSVVNLTEANAQVHLPLAPFAFVASDTSFFYQLGSQFYARINNGPPVRQREHDVLAYRPFALINELYLSLDLGEHFHLTLGKKRIVWGPGLVLNPTDLLDPAKDPTDPTFQREGAWVLRLEAPFERVTFTVLAAAQVLREYAGVPAALLVYPPYASYENIRAQSLTPDRDSQAHGALLLRLYALLGNTDVNIFYALTNVYSDAFTMKSRVGLSLSRTIGPAEIHAEALLQLGSARAYVSQACAGNIDLLSGCSDAGTLVVYPRLNSGKLTVRGIFGTVFSFAGDTTLGLEYFYNGDGYDTDSFFAAAQVLQVVHKAGVGPALYPGGTSDNANSNQKFTFTAARQHYLFASFYRPHILDYISLSLVGILNMEDQSFVLAPAMVWSPFDNIAVTLYSFALGGATLGPDVAPTTGNTSEFGLLPINWRALASLRATF